MGTLETSDEKCEKYNRNKQEMRKSVSHKHRKRK